jgi:hypothetical protein
MSTTVLFSKNYVNKVINDYKEITQQVNNILDQTGYKGKYVAQKLGLPESTFY